jgi:molecular chaperone GrpE
MSEQRKVRIVAKDEEYIRNEDHASAENHESEERPEIPKSGDTPSASADDNVKALETKLEAKEKEFNDIHDRLLRVTAEFENYKKRTAREIEDFRKFANQSLLREMLSVVDHIELAIQAATTNTGSDKSLLEGLTLTQKELLRILEKFNVKPIEAVGQPFNPEFHEAILQEPSDEFPENAVLREMQKGYLINSRLLRPSLVVVVATKPETTLPDPGQGIDTE